MGGWKDGQNDERQIMVPQAHTFECLVPVSQTIKEVLGGMTLLEQVCPCWGKCVTGGRL